MGFVKKTWTNRVADYINRRTLTKEDGSTEIVTVTRNEGTVSQEGDAFSAANMNNLESRIYEAVPKTLTGVLLANTTSLTISDDILTDTALVDIYSKAVLKTATSVTGSVIMTFKPETTDTVVYLGVREA